MTPLMLEWVEKAEEDFLSAHREYRARKSPNYNAACFFTQQCVEKYLKARLQLDDIEFGKIHDLVKLLDSLQSIEPLWQPFRDSFRVISTYAVGFRYPGEKASKEEAKDALKTCREFRRVARQSLGLPG